MKSKFLFSLTSVWIAGCVSLLTAAEPIRDLKDLAALQTKVQQVAKATLPATVALVSEQTQSSGSGVIATADGLILTAAHVVQGADELDVVFPNGEEVRGKVLGANYSKDIAMVQIERKGPWPHAGMGKSKPLVAGDWVVALGHSAGFDASRTPPVRFGRVISKGPGNFLTTDCTLIGGDSGGPLFDLDGNIIGVNSSIGQSLTNNNHAGIDGFKQDWDRLRAGETWGRLSMTPFANPEMPVLGIGMGGGRARDGVPVASIVPNSPSAAAGIRIGDVVKTFDGVVVSDGGKLLQLVAKRQPGDKVKLGISRDGKAIDITVTLARYNSLFQDR